MPRNAQRILCTVPECVGWLRAHLRSYGGRFEGKQIDQHRFGINADTQDCEMYLSIKIDKRENAMSTRNCVIK